MILTRRNLIRSVGAGTILVPSVARSQQTLIPPEWAGVSPGVVDLALNSIIPIYNQERTTPGSIDPVSWAATYGSLASMFRQWEDCGLSRWIQEHVVFDRVALAAGPPPSVFDVASRFGMSLPDGWWDKALRGIDSIRSPIEFQHGIRAMLQSVARHTSGPGQLRAKRISRKEGFTILPVQDWDLEIEWKKVGGILLILSGAIALAFGTVVIASMGAAVIAIGLGFVALS